MNQRFREGDVIQRFSFDTPYHPANDFYSLCSDEQPVCMVFLRNFGHPITRHYILAYAQDHAQLLDARLVVVVRSDPGTLAQNIPEGVIPFTILCDPEGVLAEYFAQQAVSGWRGRSGESARILRSAKKEGFREEKGPQLLPLTLLVGEGGRVLYVHYRPARKQRRRAAGEPRLAGRPAPGGAHPGGHCAGTAGTAGCADRTGCTGE